MELIAETGLLLIFNLGGGEILLILLLIAFMFLAKRLPEIGRGFGEGLDQFRKEVGKVRDDGAASDAGKSVGGIYGKPAYEALSPKNETAELYDPAAIRDKERLLKRGVGFRRLYRQVWRWIRQLLGRSRGNCAKS